MPNDLDYYRRRAADEWLAVTAATCDEARIAHAHLAKCYVELANIPSNVVPITRDRSPTMPDRALSAEG